MRRGLILLGALLALATCQQTPAPRQALFVVLPGDDGHIGAITVNDGKREILLDRPYAASESRGGVTAPVQTSEVEVRQVFGAALAARPILPVHFRLYFQTGSDRLTPESDAAYRAVFDDIRRRPVYQVEVVGHTDTTGVAARNQDLSQQRAASMRDRLVRDGIAAGAITTAGRGELDQAVPTARGVDEPRNRRVEVTVR